MVAEPVTMRLIAGRYTVVRTLGAGAMGEVYEVVDDQLEERVALKRILTTAATGQERFRREVKLSRRITHRNVARTFDLGDDGGVPFLTMELVRGESLEAILEREGPLPIERAVAIALEVARGLAAAHAVGVVHRDLKPGNVLVESESGRVVVTDFGIARAQEAPGEARLTSDAAVLGTPLYMAPEQLTGAPIDGRTDLFAFGVMLYEMVTGEVPFTGPTAMAVAVARLSEDPIDPRRYRSDLPEPLAALICGAMAREPASRPVDAEAVVSELERLRAGDSRKRIPSVDVASRSLAILPFAHRGADAVLGEGIAEELVDVLSRTRDIRVLAFGATVHLGPQPAIDAVEALGADFVLSGVVQQRQSEVRITARLVAVSNSEQVWSERFTSELEDVFDLQERLSQRIAEALRVELDTRRTTAVPEEALRLYFAARRAFALDGFGDSSAHLEGLEAAIAIAPDFAAAHAFHAIASVRSTFVAASTTGEDRWAEAEASVRRALRVAPDRADARLARAMLSIQAMDVGEAVRALVETLQIAPTLALAHHYLGALQLESGVLAEGERRLRLSMELDPSSEQEGALTLCRHLALGHRYDELEEMMGKLRITHTGISPPVRMMEIRVALWRRHTDVLERLAREPGGSTLRDGAPRLLAGYAAGQLSLEEFEAAIGPIAQVANKRFVCLVHQYAADLFGFRGEKELCLRELGLGAAHGLADVDWLDRSPCLGLVRDAPEWRALRVTVDGRAAAARVPRATSTLL